MSWQQVTYLALRCDGEVPSGQCPELLHDQPERSVTTFGWSHEDGRTVQLPTLFTGPTPYVDAGWMDKRGWLHSGDRVLCPQHVSALEYMAESELSGLPFE